MWCKLPPLVVCTGGIWFFSREKWQNQVWLDLCPNFEELEFPELKGLSQLLCSIFTSADELKSDGAINIRLGTIAFGGFIIGCLKIVAARPWNHMSCYVVPRYGWPCNTHSFSQDLSESKFWKLRHRECGPKPDFVRPSYPLCWAKLGISWGT